MADSRLSAEGYAVMLDALLGNLVAYARLYTNAIDLDQPFGAADFVQPVYDGYGSIAVERWTPAAMRGAVAFAVALPIYFRWVTGPPPLPVRGYYVTNSAADRCLWAWERPGGPFVFTEENRVLTIYVAATFPLLCPPA